jgi:16S rRNA (uracil1498-N3)-methyltransferase
MYKAKLRLFIEAPMAAGGEISPDPAQNHYLLNVMRVNDGAEIGVFNGQDGEWRAKLAITGKRSCRLHLEEMMRPQSQDADLWLLFAPIKSGRIDTVAEKATELGASLIWPIITAHTGVSRVNSWRLKANAVEAAEQSYRLSVPEIREPISLDRVLGNWPEGRTLIWLNETGNSPPIAQALPPSGPCAFLIGPEGGFSDQELDLLGKLKFAVGVGLGPRILRADTAAFAALSCWQALRGDWR